MLPTKAVRLQLGELLAADTTTLAPATANEIVLIKEPFVPTETLAIGDLVVADFDGSTPIAGETGAQQVANDPATGDQIITIKEPLGGWRWETTGVTNLPQTIFGFALLDNTLADLYAVETLATPVTLTDAGQEINIGTAKFRVVAAPLS